MNRLPRWLLCLTALSGCIAPQLVWAYEPDIHQQLTFIAARQFNRCVADHPQITRLSALDTRYIAKANVALADTNVFVRMFRWDYYNREDQTNRSSWGLIDTRFHDHFDQLVINVERDDRREQRLRSLGRLLTYLQNVTSPPHAVPVYTGRWWRFSIGDRFNRYPVDTDEVERLVMDSCEVLWGPPQTFQQILIDTADATSRAVQSEIYGFPATWESYWEFGRRADDFGEYGPAGNSFGERTEFRCGKEDRCLLLKNDPLYEDFALQRHVAAVIASMRAMLRLQIAETKL